MVSVAISTSDAIAGAYYEDPYGEYRSRRSYRKYSPQPRYSRPSSYSRQRYYQNRPYKKRSKRTYRPINSYKTNFLPERMYVGASFGHTTPLGFEINPGSIKGSRGTITYGMLVGTDIYDWLRVGIDLTHHQQYTVKDREDKSDLQAQIRQTTLMLNNYLTLPQYNIKPYLLLGIGLSYNSLSNYCVDGKKSSFPNGSNTDLAYQIGAGITFPYKHFALDGEIKYANKGKAKTKPGIGSLAGEQPRKARLQDMVFTISTRYYFNDIR